MSLEQSRRIVEAVGDCWHRFHYNPPAPKDECMGCGAPYLTRIEHNERVTRYEARENPDLSLPKNRHLLVVYVGLICDTDEKWEKFEDYAEESADWASAQTGLSYRRWLFLLPSAAIMTALLRVIGEESDE